MLISYTHALTHVLFMFVCFLELLLMQLYVNLYISFFDYSNLMTELIVYRKLLSETFTEFSKISKLIAVTVLIFILFLFVACLLILLSFLLFFYNIL
jgi:hypothetical protein